jgi:mRNA interferase RelE/StbE
MVEPYAVEFEPEARDGLRRLSKPNAQQVLDKIKWLAENSDVVSHVALTGEFKGLFKLRVGDYRVLYSIVRHDRLIVIHLIGHRRSIYERP